MTTEYVNCSIANGTSCCAEPVRTLQDGALSIAFDAEPGLYQLSVLADGHDFDWESLYCNLTAFHNQGQRTGPWDFNPVNGNRPVVPSYWVELDGERIGLWFFQRIRLDDLRERQFRGRMAFWLRQAGRHALKLIPYTSCTISWTAARLEPDPEDRLEPLPPDLKPANVACPWIAWRDETFWRALRARMETDAAGMYREPLQHAMQWALDPARAGDTHAVADLPLMLAAHRLEHAPGAMERMMRAIDTSVALPAWGNPLPEGYGHNGDMSASIHFLGLTQALHMLGEELDDDRRGRIHDKLRVQGALFVRLALLNRDYWGGSILQDHGWRSMFFFTAAALALYGILPEAESWLRFALPRVRRSLDAMPRDGVLPPSSYHFLYLYLDPVMRFRDVWLAASGRDILDQPPFRPIVSFVHALVRGPGQLLPNVQHMPLIGAPDFFLAMAASHGDADALWVHDCILGTRQDSFYHGTEMRGYYHQSLWGLAAFPDNLPARRPAPAPRTELRWFRDSGVVHYRNDGEDVALSLQAGPWCGYHAYQAARGPCDRMCMNVGPVQFSLYVDSRPVLVMPECGYQLRADLAPCLLVDGEGPYGDIGYPMSIPSWRDRGEAIEDVRWDAATGRGTVRIDLAPAYEHLGVRMYVREVLVFPERTVIFRDTVALSRPRTLRWLFHTQQATGIRLDEQQAAHFGDPVALRLSARAQGVALRASVQPTPVVWSYASVHNFAGYLNVSHETATPVRALTVDFVFHA
ncbi:MAG: hypothetical protein PHR35_09995 [Kiritimatiellae bacterium]|nr:hypothetical protein [Kiritimatiellia bacterium]